MSERNTMKIGTKVYNIHKLDRLFNPYSYKNAELKFNRRYIIAISTDKKTFAVDKFNGRFESWYRIDDGTVIGSGNNWRIFVSKNEYINKALQIKKEREEEMIKKDGDEVRQLKKRIRSLRKEISEIENKNTISWKFYNERSKYIDSIEREIT